MKLELGRELGNVAEACGQRGLDRTRFYEWKRRFQTLGFEGLKDLPPIHKSHPQTTPPETVKRIKELALEHPAYAWKRLKAMLALDGRRVQSITVQRNLNGNGLGMRHDRWLAFEKATAGKALELSGEQVALLEKRNPWFRERHLESASPGELLSADTFFIGSPKDEGRGYLHAVVDTYGSYACAFLRVSKQPDGAVAVLHNDMLRFYRRRKLEVTTVLTDNRREFCGRDRHAYGLYLDINGIEHRRTKVRTPKANGFVERFNATAVGEFVRVRMRQTFNDSVEALQPDLDAWLHHYNTERTHLGYRNQGRRPIETINLFSGQEGYGDTR